MIREEKKKRDHDDYKEKKKAKLDAFMAQKKVKKEWKYLQDALLKELAVKMKVWKHSGSQESREELYEILEATDAAVKAQYWEMT